MSRIVLGINDWLFDVDVTETMKISGAQAQEHCMCGYCRNYYASVDGNYPGLRGFLAQFGADVEGPDELCPFEPTIYEASYIIQGEILQYGTHPFTVDGIPVKVVDGESADMDTEHPEPYFVLIIGLMELPWALEEDAAEVISPANEDAFLQRMTQKLMARLCDQEFSS